MDKILITFGTRPFAQRIGKKLEAVYDCIYASSETFPDILLKSRYRKIPTAANPTFIHELLKLCLDEGCAFLLPLGKSEIGAFQQARTLLEEYGITVLIPDDIEKTPIFCDLPAELQVGIFCRGVDVLATDKVTDSHFSGVGLLSDEGEEPAWCLV